MVFSAEELEEVLEHNATSLTVVEASLTWCRPCMAFERTFEVTSALPGHLPVCAVCVLASVL